MPPNLDIINAMQGGIACTSQLKMYSSYALSNRIIGNSCGRLSFGGDGGSDNYAAENRANISLPGAASPSVKQWFAHSVNASSRIAGVDTAEAVVVSDVGYSSSSGGSGGAGGGSQQSAACAAGAVDGKDCSPTNPGLAHTIKIVSNQVVENTHVIQQQHEQDAKGGDDIGSRGFLQAVATVAQLQALLDAHPNTVFEVKSSKWEIGTR
jgi:hypothetical protein